MGIDPPACTIRIRADRRTARQWSDLIRLYRAANRRNSMDRSAARLLSGMMAQKRESLKRELGPDWRKHLEPRDRAPSPVPDAGALNPPPMVD